MSTPTNNHVEEQQLPPPNRLWFQLEAIQNEIKELKLQYESDASVNVVECNGDDTKSENGGGSTRNPNHEVAGGSIGKGFTIDTCQDFQRRPRCYDFDSPDYRNDGLNTSETMLSNNANSCSDIAATTGSRISKHHRAPVPHFVAPSYRNGCEFSSIIQNNVWQSNNYPLHHYPHHYHHNFPSYRYCNDEHNHHHFLSCIDIPFLPSYEMMWNDDSKY